ncbi:MAG: HAD-IA family hydrolase [Pseudomonadota bacterium]
MQPIVVWDFDGVLNANMIDGRFVWADGLQKDWGIDRDALAAHIFSPAQAQQIMRGQLDLADALQAFLDQAGHDIDSDTFLAYWFARDARPDAIVMAELERPGLRHVIGTNNEQRRAQFIEQEMGFGDLVDHIFASGRIGHAKPDGAFFAHIEAWSGATATDHVLIDDTARNVEAAHERGWQAFHFTDDTRDRLSAFLDRIG